MIRRDLFFRVLLFFLFVAIFIFPCSRYSDLTAANPAMLPQCMWYFKTQPGLLNIHQCITFNILVIIPAFNSKPFAALSSIINTLATHTRNTS